MIGLVSRLRVMKWGGLQSIQYIQSAKQTKFTNYTNSFHSLNKFKCSKVKNNVKTKQAKLINCEFLAQHPIKIFLFSIFHFSQAV